MRTPLIISALAVLLLPAAMRAQQARPDDFLPDRSNTATGETRTTVKYTLLLPDDKTSETVKVEERNPFAKIEEDKSGLNSKGSNEENIIRRHLEKLHVVGASPGPNGLRVMLGDMVLESGQNVPPVLPDQTLQLKVGAVNPESIELIWIEKKPSSLPPRKLTIPVELRPSVRFLLQGQGTPSSRGEKKTMARIGSRPLGSQVLKDAPRSKIDSMAPPTTPTLDDPRDAVPAPNIDSTPEAGGTPKPPGPPTAENTKPAVWEKALGFLNNLAKVSDEQK